MILSDADNKMVARLRKQQQSMLKWRWVGLLAAFTGLAVGIYGIIILEHFPKNPESAYFIAASSIIPTIYCTLGTGSFLTAYLLYNWRGKLETRLLLKLIDESQKSGGGIPLDKK
jgi:hypothetical protein